LHIQKNIFGRGLTTYCVDLFKGTNGDISKRLHGLSTGISKVVNEYLLKELDGFPMKEIIQ
jgi:hypothetical protein